MWTDLQALEPSGLRFGDQRCLLPSSAQSVPCKTKSGPSLSQRNPSYFHLHLVSDSTGETLTTVAHAAAAQYANVSPIEHVYPLIRTQKQLDRVLTEIEEAPGIVLYNL